VSSYLFRDVNRLLEPIHAFAGSEKVICPFLPRMVSGLSSADIPVLESIISSTTTPTLVLERLSTHLIERVLSSSTDDATEGHSMTLRLLSIIQQRHSSPFTKSTSTLVSADSSLQPALDQLMLSLSIAGTGSAGGASAQMDVVLASVHADPAIRAIAVRDIYKALATWGDVDSDEVASLREALRARVADTDPAVLGALYTETKQLLPVLQEDAEAYVLVVAGAVHPAGTSAAAPRALVRAHVDFLSFHFLPSLPEDDVATTKLVRAVFETIYFPFLLLSNPRHKTARAVWESMADERSSRGIGSLELVLGCVDTYNWGMKDAEAAAARASSKKGAKENEDEKDPQARAMAKVNLAVASRMAELISVSEDRDAYMDFLLSNLSPSTDSHARLLAALVLRSLLGHLSGPLQISTAHRVMDSIGVENIASISGFMGGTDGLQAFLSDESLGMAVVLKPNSPNTRDKLSAALIALVPLIPRPSNVHLRWMVEDSSEVCSSMLGLCLLSSLTY
jgi:U3 small nucleolar RNA-associated protein 10